MKKVEEAQIILQALGLEKPQQNEMSSLTLLALAKIIPTGKWSQATEESTTVSKGIMKFVFEKYKKEYAPNTRETFRRQVLHQFTQAGVTSYNPDNPLLPVNSPKAHYALTKEALAVIRSFGTNSFARNSTNFRKKLKLRQALYQNQRDINKIPLNLDDGRLFMLSPGMHNQLEVAIIKEFGSRFAQGSIILYLGDTEDKNVINEFDILKQLGCEIDDHGKLPDVILYNKEKNWLFLVEAVASHGPVSQKRMNELKDIFPNTKIGLIFVSAFPSFSEFRKYAKEIAWDTEVWLLDSPDHLIHYNGDRFVGPR